MVSIKRLLGFTFLIACLVITTSFRSVRWYRAAVAAAGREGLRHLPLPLHSTIKRRVESRLSLSTTTPSPSSSSSSIRRGGEAAVPTVSALIQDIEEVLNLASQDLNAATLIKWERLLDKTCAALRSPLTTSTTTSTSIKSTLYQLYETILLKASPLVLDPLQMATVDLLAGSILEAILAYHSTQHSQHDRSSDSSSDSQSITPIIDEVTDIHLDLIEKFQSQVISHNKSDDLEFLSYQYAAIIRKLYIRICNKLGSNFDISPAMQEYRVQNWVMPVYARLSRRFPRFQQIEVEDRLEGMAVDAYDALLRRLKLEITPPYRLRGGKVMLTTTAPTTTTTATSHERSGSGEEEEVVAVVGSSSNKKGNSNDYPVWQLTSFIVRLLRNVLPTLSIDSLESKVLQLFRETLSERIKKAGRAIRALPPLDQVLHQHHDQDGRDGRDGSGDGRGGSQQSLDKLEEQVCHQAEKALNVGHEAVATILSLWQIRSNIIGLPNPAAATSTSSSGSSKKDLGGGGSDRIKEFIKDMDLTSRDTVLAALPSTLRQDAELNLRGTLRHMKASDDLAAVAHLAYAVRETAGEEMRALVTYNMDSDEVVPRDEVFGAILTSLITEALLTPQQLPRKWLLENLVAIVALEEILACREPRATTERSYSLALRLALRHLMTHQQQQQQQTQSGSNTLLPVATLPSDWSDRVKEIEQAITLLLRLSDEACSQARWQAFRDSINELIEGEDPPIAMKKVRENFPWIAEKLLIDYQQAENYVIPLGMTRFDKTVGDMLMNADLVLSLPEMGQIFRQQLEELGTAAGMTLDEVYGRSVYLAGAVLTTLLTATLEQSRAAGGGTGGPGGVSQRVQMLLRKAYTVYQHPYLKLVQEMRQQDKNNSNNNNGNIVNIGLMMTIVSLDASLVMELIRLLDQNRQKAMARQATGQQRGGGGGGSSIESIDGWGGGSLDQSNINSDDYVSFLGYLQTFLLKELASGTTKKGLLGRR
eukprot:scaffold4399_cov175-Ochromonas_danica.AAC.13